MKDLGNCYAEWKIRAAESSSKCVNHCVWGNSKIKDLSTKLWHNRLIEYNVLYLSDFINDDGSVMVYREFITKTLAGAWQVISKTKYASIRTAIRMFSNPNVSAKNLTVS